MKKAFENTSLVKKREGIKKLINTFIGLKHSRHEMLYTIFMYFIQIVGFVGTSGVGCTESKKKKRYKNHHTL